MEADGYVAMPADGYHRRTDGAGGTWRVIPSIGRGEGNAVEAFAVSPEIPGEERPIIEYAFYLQSEGAFLELKAAIKCVHEYNSIP